MSPIMEREDQSGEPDLLLILPVTHMANLTSPVLIRTIQNSMDPTPMIIGIWINIHILENMPASLLDPILNAIHLHIPLHIHIHIHIHGHIHVNNHNIMNH